MTGDHLQLTEQCPLAKAINLIGDIWVLLIIRHLLDGPKRFNQLQALLSCISSRTLTQRLQKMVKHELLERKSYREIPPKVEYSLTAKGRSLQKVITAIKEFADLQEEKCKF